MLERTQLGENINSMKNLADVFRIEFVKVAGASSCCSSLAIRTVATNAANSSASLPSLGKGAEKCRVEDGKVIPAVSPKNR